MKPAVLKFLSLTVALLFSLQSPVHAVSFVEYPAQFPAELIKKINAANSLIHQIDLPAEVARRHASYQADAEDAVILHIQDAHANYEAQDKIRRMIKFLVEKHGFRLLLLEGADRKLDTSYFDFFEDPVLNVRLAETMMQKGELNGLEMFMIENMNSDFNVEGYGIEDTRLYRHDVQAFRKVVSVEKYADKIYRDLFTAMRSVESHVLNNDLRNFIKIRRAYEENPERILVYVEQLAEAAQKYLQMDLTAARHQYGYPSLTRLIKIKELDNLENRERAQTEKKALLAAIHGIVDKALYEQLEAQELELSAGSGDGLRFLLEKIYDQAAESGLNYSDYPSFAKAAAHRIFVSEMDSNGLMDEIEKLNSVLLKQLAAAPKERLAVALIDKLSLLQSLFKLTLTREQYLALEKEEERFFFAPLQANMSALSGDVKWHVSEKIYNAIYKKSMEFYRLAIKREDAFLHKTLSLIQSTGQKRLIMLTGGFHTDALLHSFEDKGISYISVMPQFQNIEGSHEKYIQSMLGKNLSEKSYALAATRLVSAEHRRDQLFGLSGTEPLIESLAEIISVDPQAAQKLKPAALQKHAVEADQISEFLTAGVRSENRSLDSRRNLQPAFSMVPVDVAVPAQELEERQMRTEEGLEASVDALVDGLAAASSDTSGIDWTGITQIKDSAIGFRFEPGTGELGSYPYLFIYNMTAEEPEVGKFFVTSQNIGADNRLISSPTLSENGREVLWLQHPQPGAGIYPNGLFTMDVLNGSVREFVVTPYEIGNANFIAVKQTIGTTAPQENIYIVDKRDGASIAGRFVLPPGIITQSFSFIGDPVISPDEKNAIYIQEYVSKPFPGGESYAKVLQVLDFESGNVRSINISSLGSGSNQGFPAVDITDYRYLDAGTIEITYTDNVTSAEGVIVYVDLQTGAVNEYVNLKNDAQIRAQNDMQAFLNVDDSLEVSDPVLHRLESADENIESYYTAEITGTDYIAWGLVDASGRVIVSGLAEKTDAAENIAFFADELQRFYKGAPQDFLFGDLQNQILLGVDGAGEASAALQFSVLNGALDILKERPDIYLGDNGEFANLFILPIRENTLSAAQTDFIINRVAAELDLNRPGREKTFSRVYSLLFSALTTRMGRLGRDGLDSSEIEEIVNFLANDILAKDLGGNPEYETLLNLAAGYHLQLYELELPGADPALLIPVMENWISENTADQNPAVRRLIARLSYETRFYALSQNLKARLDELYQRAVEGLARTAQAEQGLESLTLLVELMTDNNLPGYGSGYAALPERFQALNSANQNAIRDLTIQRMSLVDAADELLESDYIVFTSMLYRHGLAGTQIQAQQFFAWARQRQNQRIQAILSEEIPQEDIVDREYMRRISLLVRVAKDLNQESSLFPLMDRFIVPFAGDSFYAAETLERLNLRRELVAHFLIDYGVLIMDRANIFGRDLRGLEYIDQLYAQNPSAISRVNHVIETIGPANVQSAGFASNYGGYTIKRLNSSGWDAAAANFNWVPSNYFAVAAHEVGHNKHYAFSFEDFRRWTEINGRSDKSDQVDFVSAYAMTNSNEDAGDTQEEWYLRNKEFFDRALNAGRSSNRWLLMERYLFWARQHAAAAGDNTFTQWLFHLPQDSETMEYEFQNQGSAEVLGFDESGLISSLRIGAKSYQFTYAGNKLTAVRESFDLKVFIGADPASLTEQELIDLLDLKPSQALDNNYNWSDGARERWIRGTLDGQKLHLYITPVGDLYLYDFTNGFKSDVRQLNHVKVGNYGLSFRQALGLSGGDVIGDLRASLRIGASNRADHSRNWSGGGEIWFGTYDGQQLYMTPDGVIHAFTRDTSKTNAENREDVRNRIHPVVTSVDPMRNVNPAWLQTARQIRDNYNLKVSAQGPTLLSGNKWFEAQVDGQMRAAYINPAGDVYLAQSNQAGSVSPQDSLIGAVDPMNNDENLIWLQDDAQALTDALGEITLLNGKDFYNWTEVIAADGTLRQAGLHEKWFRANGLWHYILPNGDIFQYNEAKGGRWNRPIHDRDFFRGSVDPAQTYERFYEWVETGTVLQSASVTAVQAPVLADTVPVVMITGAENQRAVNDLSITERTSPAPQNNIETQTAINYLPDEEETDDLFSGDIGSLLDQIQAPSYTANLLQTRAEMRQIFNRESLLDLLNQDSSDLSDAAAVFVREIQAYQMLRGGGTLSASLHVDANVALNVGFYPSANTRIEDALMILGGIDAGTSVIQNVIRHVLGSGFTAVLEANPLYRLGQRVTAFELSQENTLYEIALALIMRPAADMRLYVVTGDKAASFDEAAVLKKLSDLLITLGHADALGDLQLIDLTELQTEAVQNAVFDDFFFGIGSGRLTSALIDQDEKFLQYGRVVSGVSRVYRQGLNLAGALSATPLVLTGDAIDQKTLELINLRDALNAMGYENFGDRLMLVIQAMQALSQSA